MSAPAPESSHLAAPAGGVDAGPRAVLDADAPTRGVARQQDPNSPPRGTVGSLPDTPTLRTPRDSDPATPQLRALFEPDCGVPTLRAARFPGLRGWGWWQIAAGAVAASGFFVLYRGGDAVSWSWTPLVAVAALLSGFVAASYLPRGGQRAGVSPCSLLPLALTLAVAAVMTPGQLLTGVLGVALLAAVALERARGGACAT